jgi:hypothetical protein
MHVARLRVGATSTTFADRDVAVVTHGDGQRFLAFSRLQALEPEMHVAAAGRRRAAAEADAGAVVVGLADRDRERLLVRHRDLQLVRVVELFRVPTRLLRPGSVRSPAFCRGIAHM